MLAVPKKFFLPWGVGVWETCALDRWPGWPVLGRVLLTLDRPVGPHLSSVACGGTRCIREGPVWRWRSSRCRRLPPTGESVSGPMQDVPEMVVVKMWREVWRIYPSLAQ
jgi:hypothetical protein